MSVAWLGWLAISISGTPYPPLFSIVGWFPMYSE
jgi:hypothetical protein